MMNKRLNLKIKSMLILMLITLVLISSCKNQIVIWTIKDILLLLLMGGVMVVVILQGLYCYVKEKYEKWKNN